MEGSSPHVRGFGHRRDRRAGRGGFIPACAGFCLFVEVVRAVRGFIPACAGFWAGSAPRRPRRKVHPRMCGVLSLSIATPPLESGSSPHVRGFACVERASDLACRFIPACAGFWRTSSRQRASPGVHPRMCGVLIGHSVWPLSGSGSSPHVRGFGIELP